MAEGELGKKVFFVYPPSVVKDELISRLLAQEYEVYMIKDIAMADKVIRLYPNSLVFINIDAGLSEPDWEQWVRKTVDDEALRDLGIGILTYNTDETLQKKYLMDIGIRCGFIRLKLGLEESTRILLETLFANEAKGRRKYVRAFSSNDSTSAINIRDGAIKTSGRIFDISVVGCSCVLDPDPAYVKNAVLRDVQLKLHASLVRVEAVVFGTRAHEDRTMYIMLFTQKLDDPGREKIRNYIQLALQNEIERQVLALPQAQENAATP